MESETLVMPIVGTGTSCIPLMAFLGLCPRVVKNCGLDIAYKCSVTTRIVVTVTKEAAMFVVNTLQDKTVKDQLLQFQTTKPQVNTYENGYYCTQIVHGNQPFESTFPHLVNIDLCQANVFIIAEEREGEKSGTLRITLESCGTQQAAGKFGHGHEKHEVHHHPVHHHPKKKGPVKRGR